MVGSAATRRGPAITGCGAALLVAGGAATHNPEALLVWGQRRPQAGSARGTRGRPALRALLPGRTGAVVGRPSGARRERVVPRSLVGPGEALDGGGGVARVGEELQVTGGGGVDVGVEDDPRSH